MIFERSRRDRQTFVEDVYEGELLRFMIQEQRLLLMEDGVPVYRCVAAKMWRERNGI